MNTIQNAGPWSSLPLREALSAVVDGMMYLSESEAPLELMDWGEEMNLATLLQRIATIHGVPPQAQRIVSGDEFLARIIAGCDPADEGLKEYAAQYNKLFGILSRHSNEVKVICAGHTEVHIYIASLGKADSLVLHTTAIET